LKSVFFKGLIKDVRVSDAHASLRDPAIQQEPKAKAYLTLSHLMEYGALLSPGECVTMMWSGMHED